MDQMNQSRSGNAHQNSYQQVAGIIN